MPTPFWTLYTVTTRDRVLSGEYLALLNSLTESNIRIVVGCRGFSKHELPKPNHVESIEVELPFTISLSEARNLLLDTCPPSRESIIAFPDDDSFYSVNFSFQSAEKLLINYAFLVGSVISTHSKYETSCGVIHDGNLDSVLKFVCSANLIIGPGKFGDFRFDENLGLGTIFKSGEDLDLFLWLYGNQQTGYFDKSLALIHPSKEKNLEYFHGGLVAMGKHLPEINGMPWRIVRRIFHGILLIPNPNFDSTLFKSAIFTILANRKRNAKRNQ